MTDKRNHSEIKKASRETELRGRCSRKGERGNNREIGVARKTGEWETSNKGRTSSREGTTDRQTDQHTGMLTAVS